MQQNNSPKGKPSLYQNLCMDLRALEIYNTAWWMMPAYLFLSPGFLAIFLYRTSAMAFGSQNILGRIVGRFLWRLNVFLNANDLSPRAKIEGGCAMPHPMGIVIGRDAVIGRNTAIYQNVTIGSKHSVDGKEKDMQIIRDGVRIYSGAVIAGNLTIGYGARIGANSVVFHDVPDDHMAVGVPARLLPMSVSDEQDTPIRNVV